MERISLELPAQFGKYLLLERLSSGITAEVFLAKTRGSADPTNFVAIKRILPYLADNKEFSDRFMDEAKIAASLTHPNIIRILELGREGRDRYLTMEFIRGKDLSKIYHALAQTKRRMPIPLAVLVISYLCKGLAYAHQQTDSSGNCLRIIHQDISPKNVIVSNNGEVKLIDFGMAAIKSAGRLLYGDQKGTFNYMSPEQLDGVPLDQRSDIYSVGILLYELLTGTRLFNAEKSSLSIKQQRNKRIVSPSRRNGNISKNLEQVVLRALAIDPEDRYESATKLLEDLCGFLVQTKTPINSENLGVFIQSLFTEEIANENRRFSTFDSI
jgi:serine/threonine protein kinase